jgi:hypothetical protein
MTSTKEAMKKNIHDISGAIHNLYETLENVSLSLDSDPTFCEEVIRATLLEREAVLASLAHLKKSLKESKLYG